MAPEGVIRPISLFNPIGGSVLGEPEVAVGAVPVSLPWARPAEGSGNSVMAPEGVIRPISPSSGNQRLPSGPTVRSPGTPLAVGSDELVLMVPEVA